MGFFAKLKDKLFKKKVKEEVKTKYVSGLDKSRKNFVDKLAELKARYTKIDEDYFEELEQILILSDVGVQTALNIVEATRQEVKLKAVTDPSTINEILVDKMFIAYANNDVVDTEINFDESGLTDTPDLIFNELENAANPTPSPTIATIISAIVIICLFLVLCIFIPSF